MVIFVLSALAIALAILVYALRTAHSVGIVREKLADSERENKKLSWENETLEKRLERSQQAVNQMKRQIDRLKSDLAESKPEHVKRFEGGKKVTALDILLRDKVLALEDLAEMEDYLARNPLKMDMETVLVFKGKVASEVLVEAHEKAEAHNAKLGQNGPKIDK